MSSENNLSKLLDDLINGKKILAITRPDLPPVQRMFDSRMTATLNDMTDQAPAQSLLITTDNRFILTSETSQFWVEKILNLQTAI